MRRIGSGWIGLLAIGVAAAATAFLAHRADQAAPVPAPARHAAPVASDPAAPASREESATPAPAAAVEAAASIPFSPRIYPATPPPATAPAPAPAGSASQGGPASIRATPAPIPAPSGTSAGGFFSSPSGSISAAAIDRLRAAADSGSREAACQVGIELMRCGAGGGLVSATSRGPVVTQSECATVAQSDVQAASRYLAQASAAGSDAARRALAGDLSVSPADCAR